MAIALLVAGLLTLTLQMPARISGPVLGAAGH
jgi:hypothetical protein